MTPDPSSIPVSVWVTGISGDPLDLVKLIVVAIVVGMTLVLFALGVLGFVTRA